MDRDYCPLGVKALQNGKLLGQTTEAGIYTVNPAASGESIHQMPPYGEIFDI